MLLLGFDTSSAVVSVAVHDGRSLLACESRAGSRQHGEVLAPLITEVLDAAHVSPRDLTAVAVGIGPGPFTGLRVGIVTAATLSAALNIPAHGVCSLDVLAEQVDGPVEFLVVTDARRREVYWAHYVSHARADGPQVSAATDLSDSLRALPAFGAGAVQYADAFVTSTALDLDAAALCEVAVRELATGAPRALEPMYLRRPDAAEPGAPKSVTPR